MPTASTTEVLALAIRALRPCPALTLEAGDTLLFSPLGFRVRPAGGGPLRHHLPLDADTLRTVGEWSEEPGSVPPASPVETFTPEEWETRP